MVCKLSRSGSSGHEFQQGEIVEWLIDDHQNLVLKRSDEAVAPLKKKLKTKKKA